METNSVYSENLLKKVVTESTSDYWDTAVLEWDIFDVEEDLNQEESCVCGKEHLKYLYTIVNHTNNHKLYPIGSQCIRKFEREDLSNDIDIKEQLFGLFHAVQENKFLELKSEIFSRKLLTYLADQGIYTATKWNDGNPENDAMFMMDMFNQRKPLTDGQLRKTSALILTYIKPYVEKELEKKVRHSVN